MTTNPNGPALLANSSANSVIMFTTPNGTGPLPGGIYDVWALTQNGYIEVAQVVSSASTISSSAAYPVIGGAAPKQILVPPNCMIGYASSSSGILCYQQVG